VTARQEFSNNESTSDTVLNFHPKLTWSLGKRSEVWTDVVLRGRWKEVNATEDIIATLGSPPTYVSNAFESVMRSLSGTWRAGVKTELLGGNIEAKANLTRTDYRAISQVRYDNAPATPAIYLHAIANSDEVGAGGEVKYQRGLSGGHFLALGAAVDWRRRDESLLEDQTTPGGLPVLHLDEQFRTHSGRLALYVQDEWERNKDEALHAGIRWELLDVSAAAKMAGSVSSSSSVVSPVLQYTRQVGGRNSLRLSLGRAYRSPNLHDLSPRHYYQVNNTTAQPDRMGNPGLKPELAWTLDASFAHELSSDSSASLSAKARRIQNVIVTRRLNQAGRWVEQPGNLGDARVAGLELGVRGNTRDLFGIASALRLHAHLSRNWSSVTSVGGAYNRLEGLNPWDAKVGLDYNFTGAIQVGVDFSIIGAYDADLSDGRNIHTDPERRLAAYAAWRFDPKSTVRLSLSNVLNDNSRSIVTTSASQGWFSDQLAQRNRATVRLLFEIEL
jgi:outer membrane receptor protein involved in Fe transport